MGVSVCIIDLIRSNFNGNPLLLMNIPDRKFVVLGQIFWPQDMIIFAIAMALLGLAAIVSYSFYARHLGRWW